MFLVRHGLLRHALLLSAAAGLLATTASARAQCGTTPATDSVTWTTEWCDEFNGPAKSAISSTNWTFDTGAGGWGNKELETYCAPSSDASPCNPVTPNASIDGSGHLAIKVYKVGSAYTSARLKTQGRQTFHAGRLEASIQLPSHSGLWPAFWVLGSQPGVSWPVVGESDIMEDWPTTSHIAGPGASGNRSTLHTKSTAGRGIGGAFTFPAAQQADTAFHRYGQIWSANMIQFYVDDPARPFYVVTAADLPADDVWPFSSSANPFFIILNMAVGGTLGAPIDSATADQPPMLVDYVRQYLPSEIPAPALTPQADPTLTTGTTSGNMSTLKVANPIGTGRVAFSCSTSAPNAICVVTSSDPLNKHTVDFSNSNSATVNVAVTTSPASAERTPSGTYTVTVNAFTISSSDATRPSSSATFHLTVK